MPKLYKLVQAKYEPADLLALVANAGLSGENWELFQVIYTPQWPDRQWTAILVREAIPETEARP